MPGQHFMARRGVGRRRRLTFYAKSGEATVADFYPNWIPGGVNASTGRTFTSRRNGQIVVNASPSATTYNTTSTYEVEVTEGGCLKSKFFV